MILFRETRNPNLPESQTVTLTWDVDGVLHNVGKPSEIRISEGTVMSVYWSYNGIGHRVDGPYFLIRRKTDLRSRESRSVLRGSVWKVFGVLERDCLGFQVD